LRRGGRFDFALNDAVFFQLAELRGEHFFANAGKKIAEFGEAPRLEAQMPDDQDFPLAA
jgi:hypothetical protein